ncbi:hypothetical protein V8J82_08925 [Gymnodinialimonas sp. 2305UL16-5]|uniref:hypothetical protein n=1 Tax=Gymnodinialimonas mytili TaxID=3126503 RepID=UPI0030A8031B
MTLNSLVIRIMACGTAIASGMLYAAEAGLIEGWEPPDRQADIGEVRDLTFSSGSSPNPTNVFVLPIISASSGINLPRSIRPVAPAAQVVPASFEPAQGPQPTTDEIDRSAYGLPCEVALTARAQPAAMVALDIMAPCRGDQSVTISHAGLRLTGTTDALGLLTLDMPAFQHPAYFTITFGADGPEQTALIDVPDLAEFDRIGLSWHGQAGLELHAMEFGAAFGEVGHVWPSAPSQAEMAIAGVGGFLSVIDTGSSYAQIYTVPRARLMDGDIVEMLVDIPITETNCAAPILARALRSEAAGPVDVTELSMTMPGCETVGDVLVLQNILADLRLASNN